MPFIKNSTNGREENRGNNGKCGAATTASQMWDVGWWQKLDEQCAGNTNVLHSLPSLVRFAINCKILCRRATALRCNYNETLLHNKKQLAPHAFFLFPFILYSRSIGFNQTLTRYRYRVTFGCTSSANATMILPRCTFHSSRPIGPTLVKYFLHTNIVLAAHNVRCSSSRRLSFPLNRSKPSELHLCR